ncbi:MAG: cation-translocating P-type ATPase [archaeon]
MQSVVDTLNSLGLKGLSSEEVALRLKEDGFNEIEHENKKTIFSLLLQILAEPIFILLIICGLIYFFLGDWHEALMLMGFVFIVIGITLYQEGKTEHAVEALRDLSSPRALVYRNGSAVRIAGKEVVVGDIVILSEGDRVPADCVLIECSNFSVDESLLTGESASVKKISTKNIAEKFQRPGGDGLAFIYSGTLVVCGVGIGCARRIGAQAEMGLIGKSLKEVKQEKSALQKETDSLVKKFTIAAIILFVVVVLVYGFIHNNWIESLLTGITLAMSILPEEFPVVLTVFLALGAWKMSKKKVLTRKSTAIQSLGSTTVLCTDKTGTITLNKMSLKEVFSNNSVLFISPSKEIPSEFHEAIEYGVLASQKEPFDSMEKALIELGNTSLGHTHHIHQNWQLVKEYPLEQKLLAVSHVWSSKDKHDFIIAAKGAPESIIDLCHLDESEAKKIHKKAAEFSSRGLRVIGVAKAMGMTSLPKDQHEFNFEFVGLLGFEDPIRPGIKNAISECYNAGIRVIMITGDFPGTAINIAKQIGLKNPENHISGHELSELSDEELRKIISQVNVFARIMPEQKLKIVNALKANGEIVAMTGDGVNDAPALKSAHIGIAMGQRGTDVAREASSLVIVDDNFVSIVNGVREGRRIFDNIRKAMAYVLAVHIPIAGTALITILLDWPLVLLPVHVLFLELIIDPACSIVFESDPEEKNVMKRKPRNPKEKIFNKQTLFFSILQGLMVLLVVLGVFYVELNLTGNENFARAISFSVMIISNLLLILSNRSWNLSIIESVKDSNVSLWVVIFGALIVLISALNLPFLQEIFKFATLSLADYFIVLSAAIASIAWFEIIKFLNRVGKVSFFNY